MESQYDAIIVGGGLAGSALGKSLAERGKKVLIIEREKVFHDRIRGEYVHPWGVTEARLLGILDLLIRTCGHEARFRVYQVLNSLPVINRDLVKTTPHETGSLQFYHPAMQEELLKAAEQAGCSVRRGSVVIEVKPGPIPTVLVREGENQHTYQSRLVIGADGRTSLCRKWAGFTVQRDPDRMLIMGALFEGLLAPDNTVHAFINPWKSEFAILTPIGNSRVRCYTGFHYQEGRRRLSGTKDIEEFIATSISAGAPGDWFVNAIATGPLASFDCADTWVSRPYGNGVALIGDAASSSDPTYGCGLSLTMRDARVLGDLLLTEKDWDLAAQQYATEHDRYFGSIHRLTNWMTMLMYEPGDFAAERRQRAFQRIIEDPERLPDIVGLGPEFPSDESTYRDLFGDAV
jgi:2-polyprenyl-6-methoxyphenol hydroxylase-like FAD-dependent oxidoreductase